MRFPLSLTRSMAGYLLRKKLAGEKRFPLVLMLEPLHACNLACAGCGRIREYADTVHQPAVGRAMPGGGRGVRRPDREHLRRRAADLPGDRGAGGEPRAAAEARLSLHQRPAAGEEAPRLPPSSRLFINVHLDGMEATHDRLVERAGVFAAAVRGILAAKAAGFQVCTNTTIYKDTDMHEIAVLFDYLDELGVDGLMISPAFGYEAVRQSDPQGGRADLHDPRRGPREVPRRAAASAAVPAHGLADLPGVSPRPAGIRPAPPGPIPTYNVRGWRGPCYLLGDAHYDTYRELLDATDWGRWGRAAIPRCEHCLVHCGFEPAAVLRPTRASATCCGWPCGR